VTRGRRSGREHRVQLWFAYDDGLLWLRTDRGRRGEPDWYRNLLREPRCRAVVAGQELPATMEPPASGESELRRLVELWRAKYGAMWVQDWYVDLGRIPVKLRLR
jgi:hypothetical protein